MHEGNRDFDVELAGAHTRKLLNGLDLERLLDDDYVGATIVPR